MNKVVVAILVIVLGLFAIAIASVVIEDGSIIIVNLTAQIMDLFECVDLTSSHGIKCSIKVIAIAWLFGWSIYRIKCSTKK